ncbi:hypothetical protein [Psychrobacillus sp. L4]|uniref:hypothetical protein n=1 Tax=Psychrobacillus sp. L4 TaxID=3236892 RepID=UPI0036F2BCAF
MSKKKKTKKSKKRLDIMEEEELFGEFAFIAGYTEGGAPYGILHEEMEEDENLHEEFKRDSELDLSDDSLPF